MITKNNCKLPLDLYSAVITVLKKKTLCLVFFLSIKQYKHPKVKNIKLQYNTLLNRL